MKVYELLANEEAWTRVAVAQTPTGRKECHPKAEIAAKWSIKGALIRCYDREAKEKLKQLMDTAEKHYPELDYAGISSLLSHKALISLLKEADV